MKKIFTFDGDKNRNLKLGFNGIINLEKELGKSLMDLKDGLTFEDMRTFFYVALKWEDKELTHEQTGEIIEEAIDKHGLEYV